MTLASRLLLETGTSRSPEPCNISTYTQTTCHKYRIDIKISTLGGLCCCRLTLCIFYTVPAQYQNIRAHRLTGGRHDSCIVWLIQDSKLQTLMSCWATACASCSACDRGVLPLYASFRTWTKLRLSAAQQAAAVCELENYTKHNTAMQRNAR